MSECNLLRTRPCCFIGGKHQFKSNIYYTSQVLRKAAWVVRVRKSILGRWK